MDKEVILKRLNARVELGRAQLDVLIDTGASAFLQERRS
jgi:hypothetical protein